MAIPTARKRSDGRRRRSCPILESTKRAELPGLGTSGEIGFQISLREPPVDPIEMFCGGFQAAWHMHRVIRTELQGCLAYVAPTEGCERAAGVLADTPTGTLIHRTRHCPALKQSRARALTELAAEQPVVGPPAFERVLLP